MRDRLTWTAFLGMCFAVVGLTGLFASYGPLIPYERGMARLAVLDEVVAASQAADAPARLAALRPALADQADAVLAGPGALADRVAAARIRVQAETAREGASVAYRIRLMVGVVTLLAGGLGMGIMLFALRQRG